MSTVLGAFLELVDAQPDAHAVMVKRYGLWQQTTRQQFAERVAATADGLAALGVGPGATVLLAGADQLEWLQVDLAVQATGARVCAVAPGEPDDVFLRIVRAAGAGIVFATDQETVDRLLDLANAGSITLDHVLEHRPTASAAPRDRRVVTLDEIVARGEANLADLRDRVAALRPDSVAVVAVSSGTVAAPHVVELVHGALLAGARGVVQALGLGPQDRVLSYRPLADPTERTATIYASLLSGALLALPESRSQTALAMYEVAPTYVHVTRRWLDRTTSEVRSRMAASRGIKRLVSRGWLRRSDTGDQVAAAGPLLRVPIVEKLGLDKVRALVVSGSPMGERERSFATAMRLPIRNAYALTELGGLATLAAVDATGDDCGTPLSGVEVGIDERGQVVLTGPAVSGAPVVTGDLGEVTGGSLRLLGRVGESVEVRGVEVPLLQLEHALRRSPYVREAAATTAGGRTVVTVELGQEAVARWASAQGLTFATFHALADTDEVRRLVEGEVASLAASAGLESVDELRILSIPLEDVPGALTASGRIRRDVVVAAGRVTGDPSPAPAV